MERVEKVNIDRLLWCCNEAETSLHELFDALKIPTEKADRLLKGEGYILTFNQLAKLGEYFDRGMLFFYEDGPVEEDSLLTPQYRTIQNQKPNVSYSIKKLIRHVEKHRKIYLDLVKDLGLDVPLKVDFPEIPSNSTNKDKAIILRKWLGITEKNTFSSYRKAIENKGILIILTNGFAGKWQIPKENKIRGFALYNEELPVIVVRKISSNPEAQSFTLMHELAHLALHKDSFIDDEDDLYAKSGREKEANSVASYLLIPDKFLEQINQQELTTLQISEFKNYFNDKVKSWAVSVDVILLRLVSAKRLTFSVYEAYRKWNANHDFPEGSGGSRQYRNREPIHILGKPYVGAVLTALSENIITLTKASTYLDNIGLSNINKLKESYAGL